MRTFLSLGILLFIRMNAIAQFNIQKPEVNTGKYAITDTVYMSPSGDDSKDGSQLNPVKTFQKALSLLPFGTDGVNDGQAYGLIRLLPGRYFTKNGFAQGDSQWKKGNTYKNVSIEGMGDVTLGGVSGDLCTNHVLILMGNHVFVKNIKIRQSSGIGLLMRGEPGRMMHDLVVDKVDTDSLGNFGILIVNNRAVEIMNCKVLRSGQLGQESLISPCSWPSGLKVQGCTDVTVHHCEVGFTRGEGLNFQNCLQGEAYRNALHDNTTNFYNDNSKNLIIRQNHFYNTPEGEQNFWRGCPADTGVKNAPCGILMANEGSCTNGTVGGVIFENCKNKCLLPLDYIHNVDSIFIYNNLFQRVGEVLSIWEGSTQILGVNCIHNVFFYNNTSIGTLGNPNSRQSVIYEFMPTYNPLTNTWSQLENMQVFNNIFSIDKQAFKDFRGHTGIFHVLHPSKNSVTLGGNLWNWNAENKGSTDSISASIPGDMMYPSNQNYSSFIPCDKQSYLRRPMTAFGHVPQRDFLDSLRKPNGNVGAFEDMGACSSLGVLNYAADDAPVVYPNPAKDRFYLSGISETVKIYDLNGRLLFDVSPSHASTFLLPEEMKDGMYFVSFGYKGKHIARKLAVNRFVGE